MSAQTGSDGDKDILEAELGQDRNPNIVRPKGQSQGQRNPAIGSLLTGSSNGGAGHTPQRLYAQIRSSVASMLGGMIL